MNCTMSSRLFPLLSGAALLLVTVIRLTDQHGLMIEPPARNAMWRIGYNTTPNYEDSELFCGGIVNQWKTNNGKCGICGDSFSQPSPRRYETGGKLVKDISTRTYPPGGVVDMVIQLVANHLGTFTFGLCPRNSTEQLETEECFIPLTVNGSERYRLTTHRKGAFNIPVQLPKDISCQKCIIRWHWKSANNWGICENGKQMVGCGPQETYRNCADIVIQHELGIRGPFINHRPTRQSANLEEESDDEQIEGGQDWGERHVHDDHVTFHKFE